MLHFSLPCLPVVVTAWLSALWSRGSPVADDWFAVTTFRRAVEGINVWPDFFQQRTLHIVPVEALGTHLIYLYAHGDMRWLCALGIMIVALSAWMMCRLAAELLPDVKGAGRAIAFTWITLCLFSPLQSEIWLWGLCWPVVVPLAALCAGWLVVRKDLAVWLRVAVLAFVSAFAFLSHSGGLAVGPCILLAVILSSPEMIPQKRRVVVAWSLTMAALALVLALRFNFQQVSNAAGKSVGHTPSLANSVRAFFALAGHPVSLGTGWQSTEFSALAGVLIVALIALVSVRALLALRRRSNIDAAAPWFAIAALALINAGLLSMTRAARSEWPTYTSRYLTLVTPAVVSLVLLFEWACRAGLVRLPDRWREQLLCIGGTLAFAGVLAGWSEGLVWMKLWRTQRLQSEALVAFTGALPMTLLQSVTHKYPPNSIIPAGAKFLQEHGALSGTPVFPDAKLSNLHIREKALPSTLAACTRVTMDPDGSLIVDGYADLKTKGRPADLVVLTTANGQDALVVVAGVVPVCFPEYFRFDPFHLQSPATTAGWTLRIPASVVPSGDVTMQLWAIDILQREARPVLPDVQLKGERPKPGEKPVAVSLPPSRE